MLYLLISSVPWFPKAKCQLRAHQCMSVSFPSNSFFCRHPTMLAALTLSTLSLAVWASKICPPTCQCLENLKTMTCQEKGLHQIPKLPDGTEKLYVSYNQIQEIPELGLEKLQVWKSTAETVLFVCCLWRWHCDKVVRDSSSMIGPSMTFLCVREIYTSSLWAIWDLLSTRVSENLSLMP